MPKPPESFLNEHAVFYIGLLGNHSTPLSVGASRVYTVANFRDSLHNFGVGFHIVNLDLSSDCALEDA